MSGWAITVGCVVMALGLLLLLAYGSVAKNVVAVGVTETPAGAAQDAPVVASVFVPVVHAATLVPGQHVTLHYDAYPYQKYGLQTAVVRAVDTGFLYAGALPAGIQVKLRGTTHGATPDTTTYRRVTLALLSPHLRHDGALRKVPAGLQLEVNLPQAPTPLSRWLLGSRP
jgi:membrane fusion protein